jgi:hypothetical protein
LPRANKPESPTEATNELVRSVTTSEIPSPTQIEQKIVPPVSSPPILQEVEQVHESFIGALQLDTTAKPPDEIDTGITSDLLPSPPSNREAPRNSDRQADALLLSSAPQHPVNGRTQREIDPFSIFVGALHPNTRWTEARLAEVFGKYGHVEQVKLCLQSCECFSR